MIGKFEKRICVICKTEFYVPEKSRGRKAPKLRTVIIRKRTAKTCCKDCAKIFQRQYRNKFLEEYRKRKK